MSRHRSRRQTGRAVGQRRLAPPARRGPDPGRRLRPAWSRRVTVEAPRAAHRARRAGRRSTPCSTSRSTARATRRSSRSSSATRCAARSATSTSSRSTSNDEITVSRAVAPRGRGTRASHDGGLVDPPSTRIEVVMHAAQHPRRVRRRHQRDADRTPSSASATSRCRRVSPRPATPTWPSSPCSRAPASSSRAVEEAVEGEAAEGERPRAKAQAPRPPRLPNPATTPATDRRAVGDGAVRRRAGRHAVRLARRRARQPRQGVRAHAPQRRRGGRRVCWPSATARRCKAGRDNALVAECAHRRPARGPRVPAHVHERLGSGRRARSSAATASRSPSSSSSCTTSSTSTRASLRVKAGGGLAGHNGLRSIVAHLKSQDFLRVRIGVGKPPSKEHGADHVLSKLPKRERELLDVTIVEAADAVETIVADGIDAAMRNFNATDVRSLERRVPHAERHRDSVASNDRCR